MKVHDRDTRCRYRIPKRLFEKKNSCERRWMSTNLQLEINIRSTISITPRRKQKSVLVIYFFLLFRLNCSIYSTTGLREDNFTRPIEDLKALKSTYQQRFQISSFWYSWCKNVGKTTISLEHFTRFRTH